ncbi:uncharacterized protein K02A2.6-like [Portunus trituberculatus]|uniref:uncharacterized protein K02A2.6-like n=1 Tax=Portunus trituberculatus TaxID=210409 RepID=UPI001E1CFB64|nr:uncharacterized protein K02A2.6-like [Portunus trituberculatus]
MESLAPLVPPDVAEASPGSDLALEELRKVATEDPEYVQLLHFLREDLYCDEDLVLYGARVLVPTALRRRVLARLHDSHRGVEATKRRARQAVFWPGVDADIANTVRACEPCQILQPSQQQEPRLYDDNPTRPFESISADYFSVAGKAFLVIADRLSGWPVVVSCGADTTSAATIRHFRRLFRDLGVPVRLRTDGGPQFASREFSTFLERWGVRHDTSTPHYPQSNGHAESAVKAVKHFIQKVAPSGNIDCEAFDRVSWSLNTPTRRVALQLKSCMVALYALAYPHMPAPSRNGGRPGTRVATVELLPVSVMPQVATTLTLGLFHPCSKVTWFGSRTRLRGGGTRLAPSWALAGHGITCSRCPVVECGGGTGTSSALLHP